MEIVSSSLASIDDYDDEPLLKKHCVLFWMPQNARECISEHLKSTTLSDVLCMEGPLNASSRCQQEARCGDHFPYTRYIYYVPQLHILAECLCNLWGVSIYAYHSMMLYNLLQFDRE